MSSSSAPLPAVRPAQARSAHATTSSPVSTPPRKSEQQLIRSRWAILDYYTSHHQVVMREALLEVPGQCNGVLHLNRGYTRVFRGLCSVVEQDRLPEEDEAIREAMQR